ncbi:MAG: DUF6588 family protein [Balneolaceae bacterium]
MSISYKKFIKGLCALSIISLATIGNAQAQLGDIGAFLRAGAEDAEILTKEYLKPFPTGFGTGLNAGWAESAAPKKTLGFSLQVRSSLAIVPTASQSFDVSALNLQKIRVADGENPITQTVAGTKNGGPLLKIYDDPEDPNRREIGEFTMPGGTGFSFVPAPTIQASIGLIKSTGVSVRYLPATEIGDFGSFALIGGAIQHDITQWIPGGKLLPVDISVMAGFNKIDVNGNLDLDPEGLRNPNDPSLVSNPTPDFDDQAVETSTNTFVLNALVGKTLPLISVYGGVGYQKATFNLDIKGDYPVNTEVMGQTYYNVLTDPVSFEMESESSIHMLGGFRLRLGVLAIYGEATLANYFTANAGVGISFR